MFELFWFIFWTIMIIILTSALIREILYKNGKKNAIKISATICDIKTDDPESDVVMYYPIYKYYYNGLLYKQKNNYCSNVLKEKIGDTVNILIDPSNSADIVDPHKYSILWCIIFILFSILNIFVMIYFKQI